MDEVATGRSVERSGLEAALSREDLEAVLGRISEGITLQTPDGRIVYANEAAAHLLRLETPEDVVGAPMGEHRRRFEILDRKSTRLNSSHRCISYAVFCLKKKKRTQKSFNIPLRRAP